MLFLVFTIKFFIVLIFPALINGKRDNIFGLSFYFLLEKLIKKFSREQVAKKKYYKPIATISAMSRFFISSSLFLYFSPSVIITMQ